MFQHRFSLAALLPALLPLTRSHTENILPNALGSYQAFMISLGAFSRSSGTERREWRSFQPGSAALVMYCRALCRVCIMFMRQVTATLTRLHTVCLCMRQQQPDKSTVLSPSYLVQSSSHSHPRTTNTIQIQVAHLVAVLSCSILVHEISQNTQAACS